MRLSPWQHIFPSSIKTTPYLAISCHSEDMGTWAISNNGLYLPKINHRHRHLHLGVLHVACSSTTRSDGRYLRGSLNMRTKNPHSCVTTASDTAEVHEDSAAEAGQQGPAPLVKALRAAARRETACFHFPGHNRGNGAPLHLSRLIGLDPFIHDLPELPELDDLFSPNGPILDAQKLASELFGSEATWFLVGGSTCGIQAAIMATCFPGETLILPRNSHISAISALTLSGAVPRYIMPEYSSEWDIAGGITPTQVQDAIEEMKKVGKKANALLITSPTYHGICSDLKDIANVCHFHGIPLIVDEAHGAHFKFHTQFPCSANEQGADIAVQSTHKVLGSLTQSSMLHVSGNLIDRDCISKCLQMLQSSSPSYLLLASLDAARAQVSEIPHSVFEEAMGLALEAKDQLLGIPNISLLSPVSFKSAFPAMDPLRITIGVQNLNMTGYEADEILDVEHNIISELVGSHSMTFAINLGTRREDIQRLISGIHQLSTTSLQEGRVQQVSQESFLAPFTDIKTMLSPREAFFSKKERVIIKESIGKICGELICPYPPGIPVLIPGEIITERAVLYLLKAKKAGAMISGAADHDLSSIMVCNL